MNIRVISWNISFKNKPESIADYLSKNISGYTIVNLQEVLEPAYLKLVSLLKPDGGSYSLHIRKAGKYEGENRTMGVATLVFGGRLLDSELVTRSIFPERTLYSRVRFEEKEVSVLNFHSLTGVDYKKAKSSNFASIADFIDSHHLDFFTCDANEPRFDSMDDVEIQFFDNGDKGRNASLIFGKDKVHSLNDAYKVHVRNSGIEDNSSPLAVSHVISGRRHRRYDHIYSAAKWIVDEVGYPYEDSIHASSDHSAVIGKFSLR